jgi:hypothetical protein
VRGTENENIAEPPAEKEGGEKRRTAGRIALAMALKFIAYSFFFSLYGGLFPVMTSSPHAYIDLWGLDWSGIELLFRFGSFAATGPGATLVMVIWTQAWEEPLHPIRFYIFPMLLVLALDQLSPRLIRWKILKNILIAAIWFFSGLVGFWTLLWIMTI